MWSFCLECYRCIFDTLMTLIQRTIQGSRNLIFRWMFDLSMDYGLSLSDLKACQLTEQIIFLIDSFAFKITVNSFYVQYITNNKHIFRFYRMFKVVLRNVNVCKRDVVDMWSSLKFIQGANQMTLVCVFGSSPRTMVDLRQAFYSMME